MSVSRPTSLNSDLRLSG